MMKRSAVLLCVAALLAFTAACSQTDAGITASVKSKFASDDIVKASQIDVDTKDHVVTLKGAVDTMAAKDRAVAIARETKGVTSVVDNLTVAERPAATTGTLSERADRTADAAREKAGEAADQAKKTTAEAKGKASAAAEKTGEVVSDAAITTAVKTKLLADTTTPGLKIDVDTNMGVVTLSGTVANATERANAVKIARETKGVKRVVDKLKIGKK